METGEKPRTAYEDNITKDLQLVKILEKDFQETDEDVYISQDDTKFMKILEASTHHNSSVNCVMSLPLKTPSPRLLNNKRHAENRLNALLRKFSTDPSYKAEYSTSMDSLIKAGHAEEARPATVEGQPSLQRTVM